MFKKFQTLINSIMENMNVDGMNSAGSGGVFGSPQTGAEITNPTSINPAGGYSSDIRTSMAIAQPNKKSKKKKHKKTILYTTRRNIKNTAL
jgi:hypothetical protein